MMTDMAERCIYSPISIYRRQLMGVAILLVFLHHAPLDLPHSFLAVPFLALKNLGYCGVDVFLLLSGMGLMHAAARDGHSWGVFYRRRLVRIMPTYWLIITLEVLCFSLGTWTLGTIPLRYSTVGLWVLLRYSTAGFWVHCLAYDWFVPTLLMLYVLFPVFRRLYLRAEQQRLMVVLLCAAAVCLSLLAIPAANHLVLSLARFPVFIIGMHLGHLLQNPSEVRAGRHTIFNAAGLVLGCGMLGLSLLLCSPVQVWEWGFWWYPFIIATVPMVLLLARSVELLDKRYVCWAGTWCVRVLGFFGSISFEFYLGHILILRVMRYLDLFAVNTRLGSWNHAGLLETAVLFALSVPVAYGMSLQARWLMRKAVST